MLCIFFPEGKHEMPVLILQIVLTNCLAMFFGTDAQVHLA